MCTSLFPAFLSPSLMPETGVTVGDAIRTCQMMQSVNLVGVTVDTCARATSCSDFTSLMCQPLTCLLLCDAPNVKFQS